MSNLSGRNELSRNTGRKYSSHLFLSFVIKKEMQQNDISRTFDKPEMGLIVGEVINRIEVEGY